VPSEAELDGAYGGWYRPAAGRFGGPGDLVLKATRARLAARIDAIAPPGPVLDVGAGDGTLLDALARRGRRALGLERVSDRPDVRAHEVEEAEGRYSAVVMWHSLEHLRAPARALEAAAGLLVPRGVLAVAIPNSDSVQAKLFGDRWLALDLPRHLSHIPAAALLDRIRELGLDPERVSHARGGQVVFGWLHGLVASLPGHVDLYDAIRRPEARTKRLAPGRRAWALAAAAALSPVAAASAAAEVAARRGGSVYVEARRG